VCEPCFQYITDVDISAAMEQRDEKESGEGWNEETVIMLVTVWHYSVLTLWQIAWVNRNLNTMILQLQGKFKLS